MRVSYESVLALHETPSAVLLVAGIAHMSSNEGMHYRLDAGVDGRSRAIAWKRLPGAPVSSSSLPDGSLFLRCRSADVRWTPSGTLAPVDRR